MAARRVSNGFVFRDCLADFVTLPAKAGMILTLLLYLGTGGLSGLVLSAPASGDVAVDPDALTDSDLEKRARTLMKEIRCLVCQNQSIEDSNAEIAISLRRLVREQVKAGRSNQAIKDFLVARYGDWVLLKPPVDTRTWFLWASPLLILGPAFVLIAFRRRTWKGALDNTPKPLNASEKAKLKELLNQEEPFS